ncbi:DUF4954 family protein, partial [bacterium]|nr:DUF4954 family protein [bacterium]
MAMAFRNLTTKEIETLQSQGCTSEDWQGVLVQDPFAPTLVRNVHFGGAVKIGSQDTASRSSHGPFGLYNCAIWDCEVGCNVRLAGVSLLRSYQISNNVVIQNTGALCVEGNSAFGNGVELNVLNEGGGRTLKIYNRLSAQVAYLMAVYRHRPRLIERLSSLIDEEIKKQTATVGRIGDGCVITNCQTIKNVNIGACASIDGALLLQNGTIGSVKDDPVKIGNGVYAKDFIMQSGSSVECSAVLSEVFVGQAVKINKQFSAEHSAFFANCEGFHGEACSLLAGPYTVSHHKSTLLIAALLSFYNAGSGTNQSNHMYKLGPNHQGILQRGSKTGSSSYLLWPCAVGPFSVVIGKHYSNFDTTDFPFSYINEEKGKSVLTPAMNLFTVGTRRDSQKWPSRDRRKSEEKFDCIHFDLLSPFVAAKMQRATEILSELYEYTPKEKDYVQYKGIFMKRLMLKTCRKYYEMAIKVFLGDCLVERWEQMGSDWQNTTSADASQSFAWADLCGLLAPVSAVEGVVKDIEEKTIDSIDRLMQRLGDCFHQYPEQK